MKPIRESGQRYTQALWLACFEYRLIVRSGRTPALDEGWTRWRPDFAKRLAAQAIASLRR